MNTLATVVYAAVFIAAVLGAAKVGDDALAWLADRFTLVRRPGCRFRCRLARRWYGPGRRVAHPSYHRGTVRRLWRSGYIGHWVLLAPDERDHWPAWVPVAAVTPLGTRKDDQ